MITSIAGSAIQPRSCARIFSTSSVTMARPATAWPAFSIRSASVAPDLSSAELARVGNRQHRDLQRHELPVLVDAGHATLRAAAPLTPRTCCRPRPCRCLKPVVNQRLRCSDEPWVKQSGTTWPCDLALQHVVADRRRGLQRGLDVARLDELPLAARRDAPRRRRSSRPATRPAPGCGWPRALSPPAALRLLRLRQDAEQVLHVMADLVRDHIGLRELAGLAGAAAEAPLRSLEERGVEIDSLSAGNRTAPSRSARRRRPSASQPANITSRGAR